MTTPTPAPAPMTAEICGVIADLHDFRSGTRTPSKKGDEAILVAIATIKNLATDNATLRAELAAARKVEDGKTVAIIEKLINHNDAFLACGRDFSDVLLDAASELTRLSAALKEAERRAARAEKMHAEAFRIGIQHQEAAQAAEAKLLGWLLAIAGGRRASIGSEGNTYCPQLSSERVDADIRALQTKDTTP